MKADEVAFIGGLAHQFPVLMPLLQEHLDDYDGLLPHVLMGDVTRWVVQLFLDDPSSETLHDVLAFIEYSFDRAETEERQLVAASFLENLPSAGEDGAGVRDLVGPTLQDHLRRFGS